MPRLHQDTCRRIHVALSGYKLTVHVSRRYNYYSFMSRSTCITLYPATDARQTGDNFVADTRNMLTATSAGIQVDTTWTVQHDIVITLSDADLTDFSYAVFTPDRQHVSWCKHGIREVSQVSIAQRDYNIMLNSPSLTMRNQSRHDVVL